MFDWLPWSKAAKQRQKDREDRWSSQRAAREAVRKQVEETPFRVRQNPDGTWKAERACAQSKHYIGVGFFDYVEWIQIDRADALATRALAQAAVRRFIKATEVRLDATGDVVKPQ